MYGRRHMYMFNIGDDAKHLTCTITQHDFKQHGEHMRTYKTHEQIIYGILTYYVVSGDFTIENIIDTKTIQNAMI